MMVRLGKANNVPVKMKAVVVNHGDKTVRFRFMCDPADWGVWEPKVDAVFDSIKWK